MKRNDLNARLRYDREEDMFIVELYDNEDDCWGLDRACKCMSVKLPDGTMSEPEYVHFSILKELARAAELGYSIHIARA